MRFLLDFLPFFPLFLKRPILRRIPRIGDVYWKRAKVEVIKSGSRWLYSTMRKYEASRESISLAE